MDRNLIYLLIDNLSYYPQSGTGDWIDIYATRELAETVMRKQREARLADNLTLVAIDIENLTWQEVAHDRAAV